MSDFRTAVRVLLAHEGGYADDPKDPGGATNYGISLAFAKRECPELDLDKDGDQDADDIKILTREEAVDVYRRHFWDRYAYDRIWDQTVATKILDMAVNMGPRQAHRLLQRAINVMGGSLDEDGILGLATIGATNAAEPRWLLEKLRAVQGDYYRTIARQHPQLAGFLRNWLWRAEWPRKEAA